VYPYDSWTSSSVLPDFQVGQRVPLRLYEVRQGQTTAPGPLTERELIELMDRHKIGTDATLHEHIKTVQDRKYVTRDHLQRFIPSMLGVGLVEGFGEGPIRGDLHLARPEPRAQFEADMAAIAQGQKGRADVIRENLNSSCDIFRRLMTNVGVLDNAILGRLQGPAGGQGPAPPPGPPPQVIRIPAPPVQAAPPPPAVVQFFDDGDNADLWNEIMQD
jgi:DNA topoisomerase-3